MPHQWKVALVALSIGPNAGFAVVWIVGRPDRSPATCDTWSRDPLQRMYRTVGVSDDDMRRIGPRLDKVRQESAKLVNQIDLLHDQLLTLAAAPNVDRAAINAKRDEILKLQSGLYDLAIERFLADRETLTEKQRQDLWRAIRESTSRIQGDSTSVDSLRPPPSEEPLYGLAQN